MRESQEQPPKEPTILEPGKISEENGQLNVGNLRPVKPPTQAYDKFGKPVIIPPETGQNVDVKK